MLFRSTLVHGKQAFRKGMDRQGRYGAASATCGIANHIDRRTRNPQPQLAGYDCASAARRESHDENVAVVPTGYSVARGSLCKGHLTRAIAWKGRTVGSAGLARCVFPGPNRSRRRRWSVGGQKSLADEEAIRLAARKDLAPAPARLRFNPHQGLIFWSDHGETGDASAR